MCDKNWQALNYDPHNLLVREKSLKPLYFCRVTLQTEMIELNILPYISVFVIGIVAGQILTLLWIGAIKKSEETNTRYKDKIE